jgi:hypothetical protein
MPMRCSYIVLMRWMVIYEYEVPGGVLDLSYTKLPRPWSPWESSPSRKNPLDRTGNQTRDHIKLFTHLFFILQNWPSSFKASNIWDHQVWHLLLIETISVTWKWRRGCSSERMLCRCGWDGVECYCQPDRCTQSAYASTR